MEAVRGWVWIFSGIAHCMTGQKMAAKETKLSIEWYKWRAQIKKEPLYRYLIMTPEILE